MPVMAITYIRRVNQSYTTDTPPERRSGNVGYHSGEVERHAPEFGLCHPLNLADATDRSTNDVA